MVVVLLLFTSQPLLPEIQSAGPQPLELLVDLVAVKGDLVCVLGLGPEVGHGEALVEVGAEVEHDPDGEHDVHAELLFSTSHGQLGSQPLVERGNGAEKEGTREGQVA